MRFGDHLVGRGEELGALDRVLAELDQGRAGAIELVGEPGIGKTRLLSELSARAEARGWLLLSGSASELERDLPFSVFVDALDEYVEGLDPRRFELLDDDVRTELGYVFPSLSGLAGGRRAALQHERFRSHRAVRRLLELLAEAKPLALVLDDFHWADSASDELLGALLRRPPSAAVLVALAVRPRQLPERITTALERAERAGTLTRIELGPLTEAESRGILEETVGSAQADAVYEESGGNPFYLEQLARSLTRTGGDVSGVAEMSAAIGVPSAVAASLTEELALLSDEARVVLEGAAVAGDPFEPELAAAAADVPESEAMDAVDELLRLDLVRLTDVPRRFRFRHPLVRRAVYEATPGGWRLGAHERCAAALAARGAPATARAHHIERSAREGDLEAVRTLREAGESAVRLAPDSAAYWFGAALRLLPQAAPAEQRIELLRVRAGALTATGHYSDSHSALLEALEIVPDDADAMHARLTRACASVEGNLGRYEQARSRLASALERLSDPGSPEAVELMIDLAMNALWRSSYGAMQEWAERAVGASRPLGDAGRTAAALSVLAFADSMMGAAERAQADHAEAAALVDSLSDEELARRIDASAWLAGAELYLDRVTEAGDHAARALAVARATGQGELVLVIVQTLGAVWRLRGKLADAADLADGAIEAARLLGNTQALVWSLSGRAAVAVAVGEMELALASARESFDLSRELEHDSHQATGAAVRLAATLLETGEPQHAVELIIAFAGGNELALLPGSGRAQGLEVLTRAWLALDRPAEAERAAESAAAWASAVRLQLARAWADRAAAAVDLHAGEPARAGEKALASAAAADGVGARIEAARSRALAGEALARAGQSDRAVEELEIAVAEFDRCGALRYRDQAEHELRKLGRRIHRRTRAGAADGVGIETLTARELQVARLVVDRKTNPEIAAELFLSQKTVETHLRNIFRKLGVASRVELARAVERADRP